MFCDISNIDPSVLSFVETQILAETIFMVSKTKCKACKKAKKLLSQLAVKTGIFPSVFEVDVLDRKSKMALMKFLLTKTGVSTVPQIWINGRFVGGNDDIQQHHRNRHLVPLIKMTVKTRKIGTASSIAVPISTKSARILPRSSISKRFKTNSEYGRRRSHSTKVIGSTRRTFIQDERKEYLGTQSPTVHRQAHRDEKWDNSMTNVNGSNGAVQPVFKSQLFRPNVRRSISIPDNRCPKKNSTEQFVVSNSSFSTLQSGSGGKELWQIYGYGGINKQI